MKQLYVKSCTVYEAALTAVYLEDDECCCSIYTKQLTAAVCLDDDESSCTIYEELPPTNASLTIFVEINQEDQTADQEVDNHIPS